MSKKLYLETYASLKVYLRDVVFPLVDGDSRGSVLRVVEILDGLSEFDGLDEYIFSYLQLLRGIKEHRHDHL